MRALRKSRRELNTKLKLVCKAFRLLIKQEFIGKIEEYVKTNGFAILEFSSLSTLDTLQPLIRIPVMSTKTYVTHLALGTVRSYVIYIVRRMAFNICEKSELYERAKRIRHLSIYRFVYVAGRSIYYVNFWAHQQIFISLNTIFYTFTPQNSTVLETKLPYNKRTGGN